MQSEFSVVGLGASAGGLEAFHQFFAHMPANCGMAFVVMLHLPAEHKSMLKEILARWTAMPVTEVALGDSVALQPNHVYVPYPHSIVTVRDGGVQVEQQAAENARLLRPIDGFFDSLGVALRERAVGVVLSGTGSDGALGLKALRESGGFTIAQGSDGAAPQYGEMPGGAIATGAVDLVAPVQDIPGHLMRLKGRIVDEKSKEDEDARTLEVRRLEICALLRKQLNHDFSDYRRQTFLRRVERRMLVVNAPTMDAYLDKLRSDSGEVKALFLDLLIRVTSFFRDADTFATLASEVIPRLFEGKGPDSSVRIWVPGCATGEEAYSLAMLLREHLDSLPSAPRVQVFASDIDEAAIGTARLGRYPQTLLEGLSEERRLRFFRTSQGSCVVSKEIRELCTFSLHDVIRDPPFSMMSMVSCRNLLIYMNPKLQSRIIPVFHYALVPDGILLLGGSESVAQHAELFDTVDAKARIFKRREGRRPDLKLQWQRVQSRPGGEHAMRRAQEHSGNLDNSRSGGRDDLSHLSGAMAPSGRFETLLASTTIDADTVGQLKAALSTVWEEQQSLAEEHQTALEELRSSNEELHSVNEELQSTNEELETSKEELQSLNEELHTVNLRLTEKVEELDHAHSDLKNLFDSTQIATVFLDRHLVIRNFTPAIASLYNLIPSDRGRPLSDIVSRLRYSKLEEDAAHVLSTLEPLERRIPRDDDTAHYIMRILPYREPDSTVSGVLVTFVDITSIIRAEEALVEADARKDVFLATLSHELRNPLAPIRMAAQLLQAPDLEPAQLAHAQAIIQRQVGHLSSLLEDLLDISRITHNSFPLKKAYVDLGTLLKDAVESVQSALEAKRHELRVELPETQIVVEVDPVRITQAIANLLTNAIKYTPPGGLIRLRVRLEGQFLSIVVRDNGIGLTPQAMQKVFDMFTRIESHVARSEGGLGIGLSLAKGLVRLHGGRLEVHSAGPGEGSEFTICLPRSLIVDRLPQSPRQLEEPAAATLPLRILVADDNQDAAESLRMLLTLSGHDVALAHTGAKALQMARDLRPDVSVFDIGMPDLSGYELAERIRREAWGKDMTLIAITGWGQDSDKRRALASGFNHHLTKPCDPDQLNRLLEGARA
jgi:two-component system, chemotaxis family, CheB/CheR fusion protein